MLARRHHFISQFYLRNFVADPEKPRLLVVDLPERRSFTAAPWNVALENDFHTIRTPGQEPDAVEKLLSKLEGDVAPALARVIESASLANREDAKVLLYFRDPTLRKGPE